MLSKESDEALGLANHRVNRRVAGLTVTWTFRRSAHDGVAAKIFGPTSIQFGTYVICSAYFAKQVLSQLSTTKVFNPSTLG